MSDTNPSEPSPARTPEKQEPGKRPDVTEPSQTPDSLEADAASTTSKARRLTLIVLSVCLVIFVWYLFADRLTPYTDQARVNSLTVPIVSQVPGYITDVKIRLHSLVEPGDTLFIVDQRKYEVAVEQAEANVDRALQSVGAGTATVRAATAQLGAARARLDRAQRNFDRTQRVLDDNPGALSQADRDRAETSLAQAQEGVSSAEANLEKAKEALGEPGPENADFRVAVAGLEQAQLDLEFSSVLAPYTGVIESFNIDEGFFAGAGAPLATLVTANDVWIQADMRENNIANVKIGDPVELTLDVEPGRIFKARVRSVGVGVNTGRSTNRGELPSISSPSGWLRDPQRFPVIIGLNLDETYGLRRVGGQADVIVYTGDNALLNFIGRVQIRVSSWLSYVR
jgi:multidrug resistance efflux pump